MRFCWYHLSLFCLATLPTIALAQGSAAEGFVPLIGIPGLSADQYGISGYINALYLLSISVAAFLAVGMLILAGFKYMLTDVVTQKEEAKKDIRGAVIGLLIVIAAVLILNTINPQLRNLQILNLQTVNRPVTTPSAEGIPDNPDSRNMDVTDVERLSAREQAALAEACVRPDDGGTSGRWVVNSDGTGRCIGTETTGSTDNVVNTDTVVSEYLSNTNLSAAEQTSFQQQFNQFVAAQEPEGLTAETVEAIRADIGASDVLFVVDESVGNSSLVGYADSQESVCSQLGGDIVPLRERSVVTCVR